ncbi:hypothetical protein MBLNU230_g0033t1 [Neophaeotheca triangularis]
MARPKIVRADTIDLQDQDAPSAADHSKHHAHPHNDGGLGPHQAAEVEHVLRERHSEEQNLAEAWNGNSEPTDELNQSSDSTGVSQQEGRDNGEDDSDDEEADDMTDRISSSPSIDDGGYPMPSSTSPAPAQQRGTSPWPARTSSLTPESTPILSGTLNRSASTTPDSSPFLHTPKHLPLRRVGGAEGGFSPSPLAFRKVSSESMASGSSESVHSSPKLGVAKMARLFSFSSARQHQVVRSQQEPDVEPMELSIEHGQQQQQQELLGSVGANGSVSMDSGLSSEISYGEHSDSDTDDEQEPYEPLPEVPARKMSMTRCSPAMTTIGLRPCPSNSSMRSIDLNEEDLPDSDSDTGSEDDAADTFFNDLSPSYIASGWGAESLREAEDIDFEFVYALHTFVATVEGQANATKGDTMVLLDDSNSYWWLVRIVKDSSIGYLPAEHIETPTERLARLNKHRNIDLSATMLGDNPEKSKNPLRKAMRRRNAKTVQFAAPTYVEASDYDYSDDEEQGEAEPQNGVATQQEVQQSDQQHHQQQNLDNQQAAEQAPVEPEPTVNPARASVDSTNSATSSILGATPSVTEDPQLSPKLVDRTEAAPLKSRKGTPRNTDSFLKDDSIETRKITLTPGLLRDESGNSKPSSQDSARNSSMESLVKIASPPEEKKSKEAKAKKEKKQGMLSGLFKSKKKDKKSKEDVPAESEVEKASSEASRESPRGSPMRSGDTSPVDQHRSAQRSESKQSLTQAPASVRGKLQKSPPGPSSSSTKDLHNPPDFMAELPAGDLSYEMSSGYKVPPAGNGPDENVPARSESAQQAVRNNSTDQDSSAARNLHDENDDEISESPVEMTSGTFMHATENIHIPTPAKGQSPNDDDEEERRDRASEASSPSFLDTPPKEPYGGAPPQVADSQNDNRVLLTPETPFKETPPTQDNDTPKPQASSPTRGLSTSSTVSTSTSAEPSESSANDAPQQPEEDTWDPVALRNWFDDEDKNGVKDMLTIIYDKSQMRELPMDHPLVQSFMPEERKRLAEMQKELDREFMAYLDRIGFKY